jgi:zinc protease
MKKIILLITLYLFPLFSYASDIINYQLANGLKIIVKENHRSPVIVTQLWYKVGGINEPDGLTGISHALEHMMFKGTHQHPDDAFSRSMTEMGAQYNATTNTDYTYYYEVFTKAELSKVLALEADRMQNLNLRLADFTKEIEVVKEERRLGTDNNPKSLTYERFRALAFASSPYRHPVIGWPFDLNALTVNDVQTWYQRHYAPNHAVLVVVGDISPQEVFDVANQYFGKIPNKIFASPKPQQEVSPLGERRIEVKLPAHVPLLIMGFLVPTLKTAKLDWEPYALILLAEILDGDNSARFAKNLIRKNVAAETSVDYNPFSILDDLFLISAVPAKNKNITILEKEINKQIKLLQQKEINAQELQRIKLKLKAHEIYSQDSLINQANRLGRLSINGLPLELYDHYLDKISLITPEQIKAVANKYMIAQNMTVAILKPQYKK